MAYPYVQANRFGGSQSKINRIVIHCTVSPTHDYADNIAQYFKNTTRAASAHYVVDQARIYQCVRENRIAYHAPPNTGTIGIELCDPQTGSKATQAMRWRDADHMAMMRLAANLVHDIAKRHKIPLEHIGPASLRAGKRGICGHIDVSNAFHQTDHSNPGPGFPWATFMKMVRGTPVPPKEEDMELSDRVNLTNADGKPSWGGQYIGGESGKHETISVDSALEYAAMGPWYIKANVLPRLDALEQENTLLSQQLARANSTLDAILRKMNEEPTP